MANCKNCGREMASSESDLCPECIAGFMAANQAAVKVARPRVIPSLPQLTTILVGLNVAVYIAMVASGVSPMNPTVPDLLKWGANWGPRSLGSEPWRILTSNYVHAGIIHIAFNMWCLWDLGALAERVFGRTTYIMLYLACGLGGSLASLWWHPMVTGVGASGAIFGLAGASLAALYLGNLPFPKQAMQQTLRSLLFFAGYNLFFGAVSARTDNSAHVGGLVTGLICGALLAKRLSSPDENRKRWTQGVFVVVALVLASAFFLEKKANGQSGQMQQVSEIEHAIELVQKGKTDEGIQSLEETLRKQPNDHVTLSLLGGLYLDKHDFAKAESTLQRAVAGDASDYYAQYNLGLSQLFQGKNDQAIATLQTAGRLDPKSADAQQALGQAYKAKGQNDDANAAFRKADDLRKSSH